MENTPVCSTLYYKEAKEFERMPGGTEKAELAVSRLENPYFLSEQDFAMYQHYLSHAEDFVTHEFIDAGNISMLAYLVKYRAIKKNGVPKLVEYAQNVGKLDALAYLLNVGNNFRNHPKEMELAGKFTPAQAEGDHSQKLPAADRLKAGEIVWLGTPPMPWVVLAKKGKFALLLSKYAFDCRQYNLVYKPVSWEDCSLRGWLNREFAETAFSGKEKQRMQAVYTDERDQLSLTAKEGQSGDRVFLLSDEEAQRYFKSDDARKARVTHYAANQSMWTFFDEFASWWLRSPSNDKVGASFVRADGQVLRHGGTVVSNGFDVYFEQYGVRPAICLELE